MRHYSFLMQHLTSPTLFLPWTSSMIAWQPKQTTQPSPLRFDQPLDLQKKHSTTIIHRQMTWRHTELQWVSVIIISIVVANFFGPVLHPQYKLKYFKGAKWEQEWIDTTKELVRTQFNRSYCKAGGAGVDKATKEMEPSVCLILYRITIGILTSMDSRPHHPRNHRWNLICSTSSSSPQHLQRA